ncbi:Virginiamycin B lyase [Paraconexibacter sp. AEG42_29]|uniref:Virginiamycin B lyase n=1 Tax=Paraconexibacter sp. AEG42_29 TaxID=2997339 RepID=A0AAU7APJ3_9ACTN
MPSPRSRSARAAAVSAGLLAGGAAVVIAGGGTGLNDTRAAAAVRAENGASVVTIAGSQRKGIRNGLGSEARFRKPAGLAIDGEENLIIADAGNNRIRRMTPDGEVSTVAGSRYSGKRDGRRGSSTTFNDPEGVAVDRNGDILVADTLNQTVRRTRSDGGATVSFRPVRGVFRVKGIAVDPGGGVYTIEEGANWLRKLTGGNRPRVILDGLHKPSGVASGPDGSLYVADTDHQQVLRIGPARKSFYAFAGTSNYGAQDGGPGLATLGRPAAVAVDRAGYVYIADVGTNRIRIVSPRGVMATLAGVGQGYRNGGAGVARFNGPRGIAVTPDGETVYVSDYRNNAIRKITGFDRERITRAAPYAVRRDRTLLRGIPVTCAGNQPGRCVLQVSYQGQKFATVGIDLGYIGRRTVYVRIPRAARTSVRQEDRTTFRVTGRFSGRRIAPYNVVAR